MKFALELLDADRGYVIQTWEFATPAVYQVGRSTSCDVVIGSPYVSRSHATVHWEDNAWNLSVLSRNGVFIEGARRDKVRLSEGVILQLGAQGPRLRFRNLELAESRFGTETMSFDLISAPVLTLNETERDREVDEIARGEVFLKLQEMAGKLRERRSGRSPAPDDPPTQN